jgi:hypothetical protein
LNEWASVVSFMAVLFLLAPGLAIGGLSVADWIEDRLGLSFGWTTYLRYLAVLLGIVISVILAVVAGYYVGLWAGVPICG